MLNKTMLMGRLTKDPELRATNSGTSVTSFSLAVESDFKNPQGEKSTDFIDCLAWRNTAEFISKFFSKGRMMVVVGRLATETWTDKAEKTHKKTLVVVENAYFGDSKKEESGNAYQGYMPPFAPGNAPQQGNFTEPPDSDDDLPF